MFADVKRKLDKNNNSFTIAVDIVGRIVDRVFPTFS